jgi:hypothetical protein
MRLPAAAASDYVSGSLMGRPPKQTTKQLGWLRKGLGHSKYNWRLFSGRSCPVKARRLIPPELYRAHSIMPPATAQGSSFAKS